MAGVIAVRGAAAPALRVAHDEGIGDIPLWGARRVVLAHLEQFAASGRDPGEYVFLR